MQWRSTRPQARLTRRQTATYVGRRDDVAGVLRAMRVLSLLLLSSSVSLGCATSVTQSGPAPAVPLPPVPIVAATTALLAQPPPSPPAAPEPPSSPPPAPPTLLDELATDRVAGPGTRLPLGAGENFGPGERFLFWVPRGWTEERLVTDSTVWQGLAHPRDPKGAAKVVINSFGWQPQKPTVDAWTKFLHVSEAAWEPARDGAIGKLAASVALGKGKLAGEDAELAYAIVTVPKGGFLLAIAAIKTSAPSSLRQELIDCMRGLSLR